MIGIIIYINIMQRSKEIGVMKAVGYLNRDVKAIFVYEAIWITGISLASASPCIAGNWKLRPT